MKLSHSLLISAMLVAGFPALAEPATSTVTVDCSTGALTGSSTGWKSTWTSTQTTPQVTVGVGVNNIQNTSSGPLLIAPGQRGSCNIVIATPTEGWCITGFSFDVSTSNQSKTIQYGEKTVTVSADPQTVSATGLSTQSLSMAYSGHNSVASFDNFTVTLSEMEMTGDPALTVDEMPAEDAGCVYKVTDITDGKYNDFTAWYHLQLGKQFLTGADAATAGTDGNFEDAALYCFVKEAEGNYAIYNKAGGKTTLTYAEGKVLKGTDEVSVALAQQFLPVSTEYGFVYRDGTNNTATNKWRDCWRSNYTPEVRFFGSKNNMTTTGSSATTFNNSGDFVLETGSNSAANFVWSMAAADGMYVSSYTFLAAKESQFAETATINGIALNSLPTRIEGTNAEDLTTTTIVENAVNGKGVTLSDFYVTIRRIMTHHNTRAPFAVFPMEGHPNSRRIPAITTIEAGAHAGRLIAVYDNRPANADIGAGNIGLEIALSDDNGETWSTPAYGVDADGNEVTGFNPEFTVSGDLNMATMQTDSYTYWNCAVGDAAIVSDRETGRVLMLSAAGPMNFFSGRRHNNPNQCARWYSEDGGETWTPAERITDQILELFDGEPVFGYIDSQFVGSGRIMQSRYVKVGEYYRVYAVCSSQNNGGNTRNWVLYSDDFGKTWAVLGGIGRAAVPSNGDEPKAEELPDGSVLLAARSRWGNRNFNIFRYTDVEKGEGHWADHINTDMGFGSINACDGEIMILPVLDNTTGEKCYLALQSFPYGGSRENVTIAFKPLKEAADIATPSAFTSWEGSYRVSMTGSAYSTMTWQKNNTLGFFYEEVNTGWADGMYINFTLEEITDGKYSYSPDENDAVASAMRDALVNLRAEDYVSATDGYVGQPANPQEFTDAVSAYNANPSAEAYVNLNRAEYAPETVKIINNGIYQFISAQNVYTGTNGEINRDEDIYLATDGDLLTATNDSEADERLFKVTRSDNGNWYLYNTFCEVYAPVSPATSQTFETSDTPVEYRISSTVEGKTNLSCVEPTSAAYPAIHLANSNAIVAWTSDAPASQWYMQLVEAPSMDSIESIESETTEVEETYYDLSGRLVAVPARGLYITNKGRKLIVR